MKKLQVTGDFMLICPWTRIEFNPGEPVEVEALSPFMEERLDSKQLAYVGGDLKKEIEAPVVVEVKEPEPAPEPEPVVEAAKPAPSPKRRKGRR